MSGGSFEDLNEDLLGDETLVALCVGGGGGDHGRSRPGPEQPVHVGPAAPGAERLFRRVRARVLESTDGQQRPHEYGSLLREHYLSGGSGPVPVAADGAAARLQQETVFWQSIMNSTNAADFEAYLGQFPAGTYRALVRAAGSGAGLRHRFVNLTRPRYREAVLPRAVSIYRAR